MNCWHTWEVPGDEHGGEDRAFQLPPRVELLQAIHRLLPEQRAIIMATSNEVYLMTEILQCFHDVWNMKNLHCWFVGNVLFVCAPVEHAGNSLSLADPRVFQSLLEMVFMRRITLTNLISCPEQLNRWLGCLVWPSKQSGSTEWP